MSRPPEDDDIAAMQRLADGDDLALNEIMDRWQRRVIAFLLRMTGNESVAVDLAQETFVHVYQGCGRYRPTGTFSTWLFAIAANLARHHLRWQSRHPSVSLETSFPDGEDGACDLPSVSDDPSQATLRSERATLVQAAIACLPPDLREAILLSEYEHMSYQEIAAVAGCSAKAVETRLYRARQHLRERLQPLLATA